MVGICSGGITSGFVRGYGSSFATLPSSAYEISTIRFESASDDTQSS
jgi:hypothetical protein